MPRSPLIVFLRALIGAGLSLAVTTASARPMGEVDARHLLARTGFGPTAAEIHAYAGLSRETAIAKLLANARTSSVTPPPAWATETGPLRPIPAVQATDLERKAFQMEQRQHGQDLRAWWLKEMLVTSSPLTERMTLFWHNHFVSSQDKVKATRFLCAQNATFREHALGNFADLLHAAAKDPAMVVYLDSVQNRKGAPNENFAREVMELFTLGQGHYSERDIKEAARAFTGWSIDRDTGTFVFRPRLHDADDKTIFGTTGAFDGDAVLDLLLARRETSEFVVAKLWKEFVSDRPNSRDVQRIARAFRDSHYDLKVAMRGLLESPAFWSKDSRGTLVKSPVELVVGTLRQLDIAPDNTLPFAQVAAGMGQNLFAPPNVRGWPGGDTWINSNTLLARKQFLDRLARNDAGAPPAMADAPPPIVVDDANVAPPPPMAADTAMVETRRAARIAQQIDRTTRNVRFDAAHWVGEQDGATREEKLDAAKRLLLPIEAQLPPPEEADLPSAIRATLLDPAYQLK